MVDFRSTATLHERNDIHMSDSPLSFSEMVSFSAVKGIFKFYESMREGKLVQCVGSDLRRGTDELRDASQ